MAFLPLFPNEAGNNYQGSKIALWTFYLLMIPLTFRSLVHMFKEDAGLRDIASIIPFPIIGNLDPNNVVYLFGSLWGGSQLIILFFYFICLLKYKNLLPLMWLSMIIDVILRFFSGGLHPLSSEYYIHTPPGIIINLPLLIISILMFYLSLRKREKYES